MTFSQLVTHGGTFHADDVFSAAMLRDLFPDADILRGRDPDLIAAAPGRIVFDVGGTFDPDLHVYDHHHPDKARREDGIPFSAFGLLWRRFGTDYLRRSGVREPHVGEVHGIVDARIVRSVDLLDNGKMDVTAAPELANNGISLIIETLNPTFLEDATPLDQDRAFLAAVDIVAPMLRGIVSQAEARVEARHVVESALRQAEGDQILHLDIGLNHEEALHDIGATADHVLLITAPESGGGWGLTVRRTSPQSFENRIDLPASWAGLTGEDLEAACGIEGATFCHTGRFFAVHATRDGIRRMAQSAFDIACEAMPCP